MMKNIIEDNSLVIGFISITIFLSVLYMLFNAGLVIDFFDAMIVLIIFETVAVYSFVTGYILSQEYY